MIELGTFTVMATSRRLQCGTGTGILIGSGDLEMVGNAGSLPQVPERTGENVARPERFELPTFWFVARRSIQLS